jgi:drug/metabolite transporter (DMT)-like permease
MPRAGLIPVLMLTTACVFWAGNAVMARAVYEDIEPFTLTLFRWLLAIALLLPFTWRHVKRDWPAIVQAWRVLTALGILSVSIYATTMYIAAHTTEAINISLVGSVTPAVVVLFSWLMIGERINLRQGVGFMIGLVGVIAVIARGELENLADLQFRVGDLIILLGVVSWATYSVLLKRYPLKMHTMSLLSAIFVTGTVVIIPFFAWEIASTGNVHVNLPGLVAIVYGAVCMSILSYIFFIRGVQALGPNKANAFGYLVPLFAALLAVVVLGEAILSYHFVAFVLICLGVFLTTWSRRQVAAAE